MDENVVARSDQEAAILAAERRQLARACYAQAVMTHYRSCAYHDMETGTIRDRLSSESEAGLFRDLISHYLALSEPVI